MAVERVDYSSEEDYQQALQQEKFEEQAPQPFEEQEQEPQPYESKETTLMRALRDRAMENTITPKILKCQNCDLHKTKKNYVLGRGNTSAKLFFIGEAPGEEEDKQGKPFVGNAGTILDLLLEKAEIFEEDCYVSNVLKCRPPKNRNPEIAEVEACIKHLIDEISIVQPTYIICLGNYAIKAVFKNFGITNSIRPISKIHGQCFTGVYTDYSGEKAQTYNQVKIIPMYHPAVCLYRPELKTVMLSDMLKLSGEYKYNVDDIPF